MSRDLDAMHYGRTGKNHNRAENERRDADADAENDVDDKLPGDPDLWAKLR